jgi:hypothetical protein
MVADRLLDRRLGAREAVTNRVAADVQRPGGRALVPIRVAIRDKRSLDQRLQRRDIDIDQERGELLVAAQQRIKLHLGMPRDARRSVFSDRKRLDCEPVRQEKAVQARGAATNRTIVYLSAGRRSQVARA